MATNQEESFKQLMKEKLRSYDYIRFTLADLNGAPRGKAVTGHSVEKFIDEGLGGYGGN